VGAVLGLLRQRNQEDLEIGPAGALTPPAHGTREARSRMQHTSSQDIVTIIHSPNAPGPGPKQR